MFVSTNKINNNNTKRVASENSVCQSARTVRHSQNCDTPHHPEPLTLMLGKIRQAIREQGFKDSTSYREGGYSL